MRRVALSLVSIVLFGLGWDAMADTNIAMTGYKKITFLENGWSGEGFTVYLEDSGAVANSCALSGTQPSHFGIDAAHPSYREMVSMLLAAFLAGKPVELVVSPGECAVSRTKVLSVRLSGQ
jgi:hypothetical protein